MVQHSQVIDELIDKVESREPVDWSQIDGWSTDERDRRQLEALKVLDELATYRRQWHNLEIIEEIGSGAFADVFRAWDSELHREVALKLLRTPASESDTK